MVGNNKGDSAELVRAPTHAADRVITAQQILRRYLADGENYLRLQQFDLPFEVFATGRSFVGLRSRLCGGLHFRILAMNTLSRLWPMANSI